MPIHGDRAALLHRLASALAEETAFRWSTIPHVAWAPKREWPLLFAHAGKLYMFGGRETPDSSVLLQFQTSTNRFEPVPIRINDARFPNTLTCSTFVEWGKRMWLFGGRAETAVEEGSCSNDMFCFDIEASMLQHVEQHGNVPHPREGAAAVEWQGYMLLYGGVNLIDIAEQERFEARHIVPVFHFSTATWTHWHTTGDMPPAVETVEATALWGDHMYTLTWSPEAGFSMFRLDIPGRKWSRVVQQGALPQPRYARGAGCAVESITRS